MFPNSGNLNSRTSLPVLEPRAHLHPLQRTGATGSIRPGPAPISTQVTIYNSAPPRIDITYGGEASGAPPDSQRLPSIRTWYHPDGPDPQPQRLQPAEPRQAPTVPGLDGALAQLEARCEQLKESTYPGAGPQATLDVIGAFSNACRETRDASDPAQAVDVLQRCLKLLAPLGEKVNFAGLGQVCEYQFLGMQSLLRPSTPVMPEAPRNHLATTTSSVSAQVHGTRPDAATMDMPVILTNRPAVATAKTRHKASALVEASGWRKRVKGRERALGVSDEAYPNFVKQRNDLTNQILNLNEVPSLNEIRKCLSNASNASTRAEVGVVRDLSRLLLRTFFKKEPSQFAWVLSMVAKSYRAAVTTTLRGEKNQDNSLKGRKISLFHALKGRDKEYGLFPSPWDPIDFPMLSYVERFRRDISDRRNGTNGLYITPALFGVLPDPEDFDWIDLLPVPSQSAQKPRDASPTTFTNVNVGLMYPETPATDASRGGVKRRHGEDPGVTGEKNQTVENPVSKRRRAVGNSNRSADRQ